MKKQSIFITLMLLAVTMLAGCNDMGVIDEPVENTKKSMVGAWISNLVTSLLHSLRMGR